MDELHYIQLGRLVSDTEYCRRMEEYRRREGPELTLAEIEALRRGDIEAFEYAAFEVSYGEYVAACMQWPNDEIKERLNAKPNQKR
jgi:hypothetical protein